MNSGVVNTPVKRLAHRGAALGAIMLAVTVALGAFGAHALRGRLDARGLELWETATRYLVIGAIGLIASALASDSRSRRIAVVALLFGAVVFAGTLFGLALGGPGLLGAVTPLGGLGLIVGFVALAVSAWPRAEG